MEMFDKLKRQIFWITAIAWLISGVFVWTCPIEVRAKIEIIVVTTLGSGLPFALLWKGESALAQAVFGQIADAVNQKTEQHGATCWEMCRKLNVNSAFIPGMLVVTQEIVNAGFRHAVREYQQAAKTGNSILAPSYRHEIVEVRKFLRSKGIPVPTLDSISE